MFTLFLFVYFLLVFSETIFVQCHIWPDVITIGLLSSNLTLKANSVEVDNLYELIANETIKDLQIGNVIPVNVNIRMLITSLKSCDDKNAVKAFASQWQSQNPDVFFGPECSEGMAIVALFLDNFNKPVYDYFTISSLFSNADKYSTIVRFNTMKYMAQVLNVVMNEFGWTTITIVRTDESRCVEYLSGIYDKINFNVRIVNDLYINLTNKESVANGFQIIQTTARIILLCSGPSPSDAQQFLTVADQFGILTTEFVYIIPEFRKMSVERWEPWLNNDTSDFQTSKQLKMLYENTIIIRQGGDVQKLYSNYTKRLQALLVSKYQTTFLVAELMPYMFQLSPLRDSIYAYFKAVNATIEKGENYKNGDTILDETMFINFSGVTGKIQFDDVCDRIPAFFEITKINEFKEFVPIIQVDLNKSSTYQISKTAKYLSISFWSTKDKLPPKDVPSCGFHNENCQTPSYIGIYIGVPVTFLSVIFALMIAIYIYKQNAFQKALMESTWKIDLNEFHLLSGNASAHSNGSKINSDDNSSKTTEDVLKYHDEKCDVNGAFEGCGLYKDSLVAIKRWPKCSTTLTGKQISLLQMVRSLNHDNLNTFVGLSMNTNNMIMCFWTYCPKLSLQDIVFNEEIRLDMNFKVSILRDISTGLEYLHSSTLGYHGRLFLSNCLIDNKWIVKLTDFGVYQIIDELMGKTKSTETKIDKLLCTPPEVLKNIPFLDKKKLDVYQLAMIAYQVLVREEVFAGLPKSSEEILAMLKNPFIPPVRPEISKIKNCDDKIVKVIEMGFHPDPTIRPKAAEIKKEIFNATKHFGKNLLDHAMTLLEKYATNLESIIAERTVQLNDEKKKADKLLYQMLPKLVADCLKSGQPVVPETFDCATVYFSDVVGFTNICSQSTPVQVVTMLNLLYSKFDEIISEFDAFKVETIGDAYLVVSGLPLRNEMRHITNIADMSLKINRVLGNYNIPHLPDVKLLVRIGINSGPVACGVVGLTMPRYCVFGDTVNFASRMENTGEGGKVHMSEASRNLLSIHKEYLIQKRGEIDVKGKGLNTTYWLLQKREGDIFDNVV